MKKGSCLIVLVAAACHSITAAVVVYPDDWPATVQSFFLSATDAPLSTSDATYIARFPLVVINHKQSRSAAPSGRHAEKKQIAALSAVKRANASCKTFFYLNSQIDFDELDMHDAFAAPAVNGSWWLRDDKGTFVFHSPGVHLIDWTNSGARDEWLRTVMANVVNEALIDGIFVDKAASMERIQGVSQARVAAWNRGHEQLLDSLKNATRASAKRVILNNDFRLPDKATSTAGAGQLFERWGSDTDHDLLNITADMARMSELSSAGVYGLLARSGGEERGGGAGPGDPAACGAGLAEFLVSVQAPGVAFFACQQSFASGPGTGWMAMLDDVVYREPLGRPLNDTATPVWVSGNDGAPAAVVLRRAFESGAVAWLDPTAANHGCVKWASGLVNGTCPPGVAE